MTDRGRAVDLLGLRHAGSTAIDVDLLLARVTDAGGKPLAAALATAVCDVLSAAIAFCDPQLVVIGGAWGMATPVINAVRTRMALLPRSVPLEGAVARGNSALAGARSAAVAHLRSDIIARSRTS